MFDRYEATDMNVFRSALSACVVADLPNINDFIHQNRHMLMEEKRQKLLALNQVRSLSRYNITTGINFNLSNDSGSS